MLPQLSHIFSKSRSKAKLSRASTQSSSLSSSDSASLYKSHSKPCPSELLDDASNYEQILRQCECINQGDSQPGLVDLVANEIHEDGDIEGSQAKNTALPLEEDDGVPLYDHGQSVETSDFTPIIHRASSVSERGSLDELEYQDIVDILIQEFGILAGQGVEEKLLLETDGCLIQHVAIVGVIHLTTHRLTFHASLLSPSADPSSQDVIKTGPAVMHRKGWRSKRRVWIELSKDVICVYASSKEEEKVRPMSALPLSFVDNIVPFDKRKKRVVQLSLLASAKTYNDYAEFDTEESANDWRRELSGALFNYRLLKKDNYSASAYENGGIRLNFPLTLIKDVSPVPSLGLCSDSLKSIQISATNLDLPLQLNNQSHAQVFTLGPFGSIPVWDRLHRIILDAKGQQHFNSNNAAQVTVDYGPYDLEAEHPTFTSSSDISVEEETDIRYALGINLSSQLWIVKAHICGHVWGHFVIGDRFVGFWNKNTTHRDVHYRIAMDAIVFVRPFTTKWISVNGLKLGIEDKAGLRFIFKSASVRDEAIRRIDEAIHQYRQSTSSDELDVVTPKMTLAEPMPSSSPQSMQSEESSILKSQDQNPVAVFSPITRTMAAATAAGTDLSYAARCQLPKVINVPREILITRKILHFVCLTIGSRGDVQPYIALGLGLKKEGHSVTIVTHEEYRDWIVGFGLGHRSAGGDPGALMKLSVEHKMFSPEFFKESLTKFRSWLDQLLVDSWSACQDADVLLESPSAMAGVHIAEGLNIPYFRAFTMPWTKTTAFPHAFLSPPVDAPAFNSASYVLFNNVMWAATSKQINKWRRQTLKIKTTDMAHMAQSKITFIYNFSRAVVPKPLDWPDTTIISGYWFLDNPELNWEPPDNLLEWMEKARNDGKPIVYIGFGSITVPRPNKVTGRIVDAVLQSDVRAIITKGWSGRMGSKSGDISPPVVPAECFFMEKVPHDWLFPRIDAALHHGGAGTTGASLRAGIPTIIKPWFGDQFFWASRVTVLGAGLKLNTLHVDDIARALMEATRNPRIKAKANLVGQQIRQEDGVHTTIYTIYTYLHRASQDRSSLDKL